MIIAMAKVRVVGPHSMLNATLSILQDFGEIHLDKPEDVGGLLPRSSTPREERRRAQLERIVGRLDEITSHLDPKKRLSLPSQPAQGRHDFTRWARLARDVSGELQRLAAKRRSLKEESALLKQYEPVLEIFRSLAGKVSYRMDQSRAFVFLLKGHQVKVAEDLRRRFEAEIGPAITLSYKPTSGGDTVALLVAPRDQGERIDELLAHATIRQLTVPSEYAGHDLVETLPMMRERIGTIVRDVEKLERERIEILNRHGGECLLASQALHDYLIAWNATALSGSTDMVFVLEGWLPERSVPQLASLLEVHLGSAIVMERIAGEEWTGEDVPVVLSNPRLFKPFEIITGLLPLPVYGSIDPTPFVAVLFPMFFGIILGDVGYGAVLGIVAAILHITSERETAKRAVSEVAGACSLFTIVFGVLYGEWFGDLGRRLLGFESLIFNREEATLPFLMLAIALGFVHVTMGFLLNLASRTKGARKLVGSAMAAAMVVLVAAVLMAAFGVLPSRFFTPGVVVLLLLFPVLVAVEGIIAPIEILSALSNVLSYARIMALGTASVMMATVANRMVGAVGSLAVGMVFALLFHLVNFVIGVFSPTVHVLRLHYVEFFGKFYSPGGVAYQPFRHWNEDVQHVVR